MRFGSRFAPSLPAQAWRSEYWRQWPLRRPTSRCSAGSATLEASARDLGLDETVIEVVRKMPGVVKASPLIEEAFVFHDARHGPESVQVYGVDLLDEADQSGFRLERGAGEEVLTDLL